MVPFFIASERGYDEVRHRALGHSLPDYSLGWPRTPPTISMRLAKGLARFTSGSADLGASESKTQLGR